MPPDLPEPIEGDFEPLPDDLGEAALEYDPASTPPLDLSHVPDELRSVKAEIDAWLVASASGRASGGLPGPDDLLGAGNVQGTGIGAADPTGAAGHAIGGAPGEPVLTVFVAEPATAERVVAALAAEVGVPASAWSDLPVSVHRSGLIEARTHKFRLRPAPVGISIGHEKVTAGTYGLTVTRWGRPLMLSNNHVIANSNDAKAGDCITQPGPYDGGRCSADQIAVLDRFVNVDVTPGAENYVDAATAAPPTVSSLSRQFIYHQDGKWQYGAIGRSVAEPKVGMQVGKSGRTTQLTQGTIKWIDMSVQVRGYSGDKVAFFKDQFGIQSYWFSAGGDSGSCIWTWDALRYPVGLLFAGGDNVTVANRMSRALNSLDVSIPGIWPTGDTIEAVREQHEQALLALAGVQGVASGTTATGTPAITVFVRETGDRAAVPAELGGYPVVVEAVGEIVTRRTDTP